MNKDMENRYIEARKKVIESDFSKLNPMQRKAVMATEGPLLILAGAGSGKTTVLINRIANLLRYGSGSDTCELPEGACEEDIAIMERGGEEAKRLAVYEPVDPWRILAITFTNKAADELKARLEKMLGPDANDIWASTFHSACVRILRRDADRLGFPQSFTIYDTADSLSLVKRILKDFELDDKRYPPRMLLTEISRAKDEMLSPENYFARAKASGDIRRVKIAEIYSEYSRRSYTAGAMDFDDLIFYTVKLLQDNDDVRAYWQRRFKYVLIDEYQDTNKLQYMLASLLAGGWGNICVVGDDDQSIYKFRGATIENILSFEEYSRFCFVWICYIGTVIAFEEKRHICVDLISSHVKGVAKTILTLVNQILILCASSVVLRAGLIYLRRAVRNKSAATHTNMGIVVVGLPLMAASIIFIQLLDMYKMYIKKNKEGDSK